MGWETIVCDGSSEHLEYSLTIKKKLKLLLLFKCLYKKINLHHGALSLA